MRKFSLLTTLTLISLTSIQCFYGIARIGSTEWVNESFEITEERKKIKHATDFRNPPIYSKADIIAKWGEPSNIGKDVVCDYIAYRDGLEWNFIGVIVGFIPIPLLIFPSGFDYIKIYFKEEKSVGLTKPYYNTTHSYGYKCDHNNFCSIAFGRTSDYQYRQRKPTVCFERPTY
ncbi:hypothetical protein [Leptospira meyeri]|uniref:hypothetical protein n=1 Tax=Leptospira meyeri TaxID=29508 RepID=UPI0002BF1230|nr:hypothetical protein [Leptospira meyeri]EMJ85780.1 hypothetical protein LEP1GSC196_0249 [Leptospira meyeri serovar Semaranga str. Veldrot Semarang 173]